jgi:hypothetical protein
MGSGCIYPLILDFLSDCFTPQGRAPGIHWIGGWVGPRTGLDDVEKRKFLPLPELELRPLGSPPRSQSLYRLRFPSSFLFTDTGLNCMSSVACIERISLGLWYQWPELLFTMFLALPLAGYSVTHRACLIKQVTSTHDMSTGYCICWKHCGLFFFILYWFPARDTYCTAV